MCAGARGSQCSPHSFECAGAELEHSCTTLGPWPSGEPPNDPSQRRQGAAQPWLSHFARPDRNPTWCPIQALAFPRRAKTERTCAPYKLQRGRSSDAPDPRAAPGFIF
jgi:hypothetical protein